MQAVGDTLFRMEHRQKHITAYYELVEILSNAEALSYKLSTENYMPEDDLFAQLVRKINMANEAKGKTRKAVWQDIWGYMDEYKKLMIKELEEWHWTTTGEIQAILNNAVIEESDEPKIISLWRRFVSWASSMLGGEQDSLKIWTINERYEGYKPAYKPYTLRYDQSIVETIEDLAYKTYTNKKYKAAKSWYGIYGRIVSIMEDPYKIVKIGTVMGYINNHLAGVEPFRIVLPSNPVWLEDLWSHIPGEVIELRKQLKGD
ncbi:MAG: hypothetical protein QW815_02690 [Nitrososphaerota archaeon]